MHLVRQQFKIHIYFYQSHEYFVASDHAPIVKEALEPLFGLVIISCKITQISIILIIPVYTAKGCSVHFAPNQKVIQNNHVMTIDPIYLNVYNYKKC